MKRARRCALALCSLAAIGLPASAVSAPELAAIGSLSCTTSDRPFDVSEANKLSCRYDGRQGGDGDLRGTIMLRGPAAMPAGKRVLKWSVLSRRGRVTAASLAGRYSETAPGRLIGGSKGIVVLQAPGRARSRDASVTVIELQLQPMQI